VICGRLFITINVKHTLFDTLLVGLPDGNSIAPATYNALYATDPSTLTASSPSRYSEQVQSVDSFFIYRKEKMRQLPHELISYILQLNTEAYRRRWKRKLTKIHHMIVSRIKPVLRITRYTRNGFLPETENDDDFTFTTIVTNYLHITLEDNRGVHVRSLKFLDEEERAIGRAISDYVS
jgi:hypothetical protein